MKIAEYLEKEKGVLLTEAQRSAVETASGAVLLLAVPGAGKTTVIAARAAYCIYECGGDPRRILTVTFNREAARDMLSRWEQLFGGLGGEAPRFSTIHAFCYSLLREYAAARGRSVPKLISGDGARLGALLAQFYRDATGEYMTEDIRQRLENAMGYAVNMQLAAAGVKSLDAELPGFSAVYGRYTAYKRENALMDFDDMLLFAHTALERQPHFRERVASRYDHILVDEVQDTSKLQHAILALLARDDVFMVGDEDQSIYGFRGAYPRGVMELASGGGVRLLKLEDNYRSNDEIVKAASLLISDNRDRVVKNIRAVRGAGGSVSVTSDVPLEREYEYIAGRLRELPPGESCAVLYRNGFSGIALSRALRRAGVEYACRPCNIGYPTDAMTREILGLMTFAADRGDAAAFTQIYYRLGTPISRDAAHSALAAAPPDFLRWVTDSADYPSKNTGRLLWTARILNSMAGETPSRQLDMILEELQYLTSLERRGQSGYAANQQIQKLVLLRDIARDAADLAAFRELVRGAEAAASEGAAGARVSLLTAHSAKGREFDRVIIADALEGIFPDSSAVEDNAIGVRGALEEERRLFYTAMTRARSTLEIVAPPSGLGRPLIPSRFVSRLDESVPRVGGVAIVIGTKLAHSTFGMGEVTALSQNRGLFTARFSVYGEKTFKLEALSDAKLFGII